MLGFDLAQYTGLTKHEVHTRMADVKAVPEQWKAEYGHKEGQPEDYHRFYTFNWKYLFDLANFAGEYKPELANADKYMKGRCLDFGCGIGTVAVDLAKREGVKEVHAIDVCIITADFLKYRVGIHGLNNLTVLDPTFNKIGRRCTHVSLIGQYDFIYARDVLEHCIDRVNIVSALCDHVVKGGVLVEATPIEFITSNDGWENVRQQDRDLWHVLEEKGFKKIESAPTGGMSMGNTNVWQKS